MNIALIGYGKMGKAVEKAAVDRNHRICCVINSPDNLKELLKTRADVAIEFSAPESGYKNVRFCIENNIPVVSGTTGWIDKLPIIHELCEFKNGAFFYASNYSVGMNVFMEINKKMAQAMEHLIDYEVKIEEIHHAEKKDSPSGTAITLANQIIDNINRKESWVLNSNPKPNELEISAIRTDNIPGTHTIFYKSVVDDIELKHIAHNRDGFAQGAVLAAEFLKRKKYGNFTMNDLLNF